MSVAGLLIHSLQNKLIMAEKEDMKQEPELEEKASDVEELEKAGLSAYYTDHGIDVYPVSAAGNPWTASYIAAKGDPIANLQEDLAADK